MSGLSPLARLLLAKDKLVAAERKLEDELRALFPVGGAVDWMNGQHRQNGVVLRHIYGDRLFARNVRTGRVVKLSSSTIIDALQADEDRDIARELEREGNAQ